MSSARSDAQGGLLTGCARSMPGEEPRCRRLENEGRATGERWMTLERSLEIERDGPCVLVLFGEGREPPDNLYTMPLQSVESVAS